ncbi:MAG: cell division protein FtsA [Pseudomonadota bacterium]|nr:cell division protein FtsA [Pseudomonadota bacterium]
MAQDEVISALDVGSSKVTCFIAENDSVNGLRVLGIGHHASNGVKAGNIVDMDSAETAVRAAVTGAEEMAEKTVRKITVNMSAGQMQSSVTEHRVPVGGATISESDLNKLLMECRSTQDTQDRALVHAIPIGFDVDGEAGIHDPRGLHGRELGVKMHSVSITTSALHNLATCISRCHLELRDLVITPYAAGLGCLVEDELDLGATIVDIGAGTTSLAIFFDGALIHVDSIPLGGWHITSDIARGLSTPINQAERIKTLYGSCEGMLSDERTMIAVQQIGEEDEIAPEQVPKSMLTGIITPRVEEILEIVRSQLLASGLDKIAGRRAVLTGGACQLEGIPELASKILKKQVRIGRPRGIAGLGDAMDGPAFSVNAGLLAFAIDDQGEIRQIANETYTTSGGLLGRLGGWFRENF